MINLMIFESGGGQGGSAAYLYSFLKLIDKNIFNTTIVFKKYVKGSFIEKISDLGVHILRTDEMPIDEDAITNSIGLRRILKLIYRSFLLYVKPIIQVYRIITKNKPDIIMYNQDVIYHIPKLIATKLSGVPCVVRKCGVGTYEGKKKKKFLSGFPDVFICSSNAEYRNHLESNYSFKEMMVIYEGVDVDEFKPGTSDKDIRNELGLAQDDLLIALISRIDEGKGHDDLIKAASIVLKEFPKCVFLIVGDGDNGDTKIKNSLEDLSNSLNIEKKVIFTGWRNDTLDILRTIDIFVHCPNTWREGMGIATLEAISCGKPVVITDNWGLSDTTEDGSNGFVVPIGDTSALADRLLRLLKDKDMRATMGQHSRSRAQELFNMKKNIKKIEEILIRTVTNN
jgi:glycosyltransferase involved in cell wall biosynthesis